MRVDVHPRAADARGDRTHCPSSYSCRPGRLESLKDAAKSVFGAAFAPGGSALLAVLLAPCALSPAGSAGSTPCAATAAPPSSRSGTRPRRRLRLGTTLHPFGRALFAPVAVAPGHRGGRRRARRTRLRRARAAGLRVTQGDLLSADLPASAYDVVRFNHSFEHTHDPAAYLAARALLKPGGLLVVSVPNYDGATYDLSSQAVESPAISSISTPPACAVISKPKASTSSRSSPSPPEASTSFAPAPRAARSLPSGEEVFSLLPDCQSLAAQNRGDDLDLVARKR